MKNVAAARAAGRPVREFVDANAARFVALRDGLGNLVQRTLTLVHRLRDGAVAGPDEALPGLVAAADALPAAIDRALDGFDLRSAAAAAVAVVDQGNRTIEAERPWAAEHRGLPRTDAVLAGLVHACRVVAGELTPFLPGGAARLQAQLGAVGDPVVGRPEPAFERRAHSGVPRP